MKRFFVVSLVLVFVVALMAVPAMAASSYAADSIVDGVAIYSSLPSDGEYTVSVNGLVSDPFPFTPNSDYDQYGESQTEIILSEYDYCYLSVGTWDSGYCISVSDSYGEMIEVFSFELFPVGSESVSPSPASIFVVFAGIGNWLTQALTDASSIFYQAESGLTLLGTLSVCGLAVAVVFLLIGWIRRMLLFRH